MVTTIRPPRHPATPPARPPLVRALLRARAYPHQAGDLKLCETHLSWVVLAGSYAYKIKKPVNLGFADFSTIERRRAACTEEVRLNQRLCPDVYLGTVEIVEREGAYFVGGPGRPVEPAVWMRRLPEAGMLPRLLERGGVDAALLVRVAGAVARFHASAPTGPGVDEWGEPEAIAANWAENFAQTARLPAAVLPPARRAALEDYVRRFLTEEQPLLAWRVADGYIRDGHGDLHAANICVEGRRLRFFDCLEFSPRHRCADVASEVAFLAMDLEHAGRADLGETFVDAYVRASGDEGLRELLAFYKCYRAYVRGKVLGLRLGEPGLPAAEAMQLTAQARAYFELAWACAGGLGGPTLVVTLGLPASGKTTLARALAGRLGLVHLSSDVLRKELAGLGARQRGSDAFGRGLYDPAMTRRTYAALRRRAARWLRRGRSVALDATYGRPAERATVRRLAARVGAPLVVIHCQASEATLLARLAARAATGGDASDARPALWPALRAAFTPPDGEPGTVAVDTDRPPAEVVDAALAAICGARRSRS